MHCIDKVKGRTEDNDLILMSLKWNSGVRRQMQRNVQKPFNHFSQFLQLLKPVTTAKLKYHSIKVKTVEINQHKIRLCFVFALLSRLSYFLFLFCFLNSGWLSLTTPLTACTRTSSVVEIDCVCCINCIFVLLFDSLSAL